MFMVPLLPRLPLSFLFLLPLRAIRPLNTPKASILSTMATPIRIDSPLYSGSQPHRVLVVGGSYGGLTFVSNLLDIVDGKPSRPYHRPIPDFEGRTSERGVEIILLDERDGFFHTVGAPLAHTAKKTVSSFWKEYSALEELQHPKLKIVQGKIENIDCTSQMATYVDSNSRETVQHGYDYLVMATGLGRQWPIVPESHKKDRYVVDALKHINSLSGSKRMVVIGGGKSAGARSSLHGCMYVC